MFGKGSNRIVGGNINAKAMEYGIEYPEDDGQIGSQRRKYWQHEHL